MPNVYTALSGGTATATNLNQEQLEGIDVLELCLLFLWVL